MLDSFPELPPVFRTVIEQMRAGGRDGASFAEMSSVADQLDETYLDLQDEEKPGGRTAGWERAQSVARAAFAIREAMNLDAFHAAAESIYEAAFALDEE